MAKVRPELHLTASSSESMRREIQLAGGNEVCFLASVTDDGGISEPRPVARGHATAVLAAIHEPEPGGVVVHNHPSGMLSPSAADLTVAASLWEQGLGFAIIDNDATELYVVVEPPQPEAAELLDLDEIEAALAPGGLLAARHPSYEDRPQQREMARLIASVYNDGGIAIAEAGTGTGKSVAYLLPAIRWALANRERTVVSTNTINLQEQLVDKDLPLLRRALGEPFRFSLVKGRKNYVSIRRALLAAESAPSLLDGGRQTELTAIVEWLDATQDGSLSDLPFRPSAEVWDEVASESDVCLRAKCPHFEQCFYQRARRDAASADVLVVNHHLLFSDLAVRHAQGNYTAPAVLPHYKRLILDEAHNLEESATQHLGAQVTRRNFFRVLGRLESRNRGLLPALTKLLAAAPKDLLTQSAVDLLNDRIRPALEGARQQAADLFVQLDELLHGHTDSVLRIDDSFEDHPIWEAGLRESLPGVHKNLDVLLEGLQKLREQLSIDERSRETFEQQILELRGSANRVEGLRYGLESALRPRDDAMQMVRWMERRRASEGDANITLAAAPLDLSTVLKESLIDQVESLTLTSATLATGSDFSFLRSRIGLGDEDANEAVFASPFDFDSQSLLAVPTDLPIPQGATGARHDEATVRATEEMASITDGGIFVLFTSYRALRNVAEGLRRRGADQKWPLLVHGEAPRANLVERFVESGRAVLLGTSSFWEGVDVPGHPLRGLLIPKLPFKVPSEPITAARIEAIEAAGKNAFSSYMLPHAAVRLKQGFGRLIRSRTDRGAVLLLDARIAQKSYGRYLLRSLPPAPVTIAPWKEVRQKLVEFYAE